MKHFLKALRLVGVIILIVMASVGAGLIPTPVPPNRRRENIIELKVELKEEQLANAEELKFEQRE